MTAVLPAFPTDAGDDDAADTTRGDCENDSYQSTDPQAEVILDLTKVNF